MSFSGCAREGFARIYLLCGELDIVIDGIG